MRVEFTDPDSMPATDELFLCSKNADNLLSPKIKQWLFGLLKIKIFTEKIQERIIEHLSGILNLKKSMDRYASSFLWLEEFKPLFLFSGPECLGCFDETKLDAERIALIPELFRKVCHHANAEVFRHHIELVIPVIKKYAEDHKEFQEVYEKKLYEVRAASTTSERSCDYFCGAYYTPRLIAELEGIGSDLIEKKLLPYLLYDRHIYETIVTILRGKYEKNIIPRIADLPADNHSPQIFINIAAKKNNVSMLERLFDGLPPDKILELFFAYFHDKILQKEWFADIARADFPELLYINLETDIKTLSSARQDFKLFIKYLTKFFKTAPENDRLVFLQTLFPLTAEAPQRSGGWTIGHFAYEERGLYEDFVNLLAGEAAKFPNHYLY